MKKAGLVLTILMGLQVCHAQTWAEWFRQRKTQIDYLFKQIAALKVYSGYLEKGYNIARDGTTLINNIKHGDFNLHNGYFTSLKTVSPSIKNSARVASIISDQLSILKLFGVLINYSNQSDQLSAEDKDYINAVYSHLKDENAKDLDELFIIITSGKLEMKDNERLKKIEGLYNSMNDKLSFSRSFCNQVFVLIQQRASEKAETEGIKQYYGVK
jgi:hypothetical protein